MVFDRPLPKATETRHVRWCGNRLGRILEDGVSEELRHKKCHFHDMRMHSNKSNTSQMARL